MSGVRAAATGADAPRLSTVRAAADRRGRGLTESERAVRASVTGEGGGREALARPSWSCPMTHDRTDVYTRITAEIVAAIEAGAGEFKMPWHHNGTSTARPANIASGKAYRGVNVLALWVAAEIAHYDNGLWGTYRQWQALEAQVRKGEHGTTVVLWKELTPAGDDDRDGDEDGPARRIFARAFTVFNVAQVEGYQPEAVALLPETERLAHAEAFIGNLGINTVFGSPNACYRPATDTVHMPDFGYFHEAAGFYGSW